MTTAKKQRNTTRKFTFNGVEYRMPLARYEAMVSAILKEEIDFDRQEHVATYGTVVASIDFETVSSDELLNAIL